MKNIVLVGFMGSGKTTVSKALSKKLKRNIFSTDDILERLEGRKIAEIFRVSGEAYFRQKEKEVVKSLSDKKGAIIDCGGGVVLDKENVDLLSRNGLLFYLKASAEFIYDQIKENKDRPLLNVPDPLGKIKEMIKERQPYYVKAHFTVSSEDKNIDNIADQIIKLYENKS